MPATAMLSTALILNINNGFLAGIYQNGENINTVAIKQIKRELHFIQSSSWSRCSFTLFSADRGIYGDLIIQNAGYSKTIFERQADCILHSLILRTNDKSRHNNRKIVGVREQKNNLNASILLIVFEYYQFPYEYDQEPNVDPWARSKRLVLLIVLIYAFITLLLFFFDSDFRRLKRLRFSWSLFCIGEKVPLLKPLIKYFYAPVILF
jgi:hypothetical protein